MWSGVEREIVSQGDYLFNGEGKGRKFFIGKGESLRVLDI
jgi:hypothetical protein